MPDSVNPATEETVASYAFLDDQALESKLSAAEAAYRKFKAVSYEARARMLRRAGELVTERAEELGALMTQEMGKPLAQAVAEAKKCAWVCDYYAEHGAEFLAPDLVETDAAQSMVRYDPLGPILAIMPWNFPFWQVFRFAAPNLMAGNVGLLKHSPNVCGCALAIEQLFADAGFEEGTFQTLIIDVEQTASVIRDRRVRGVSLTGSVRAGRAVASIAGESLKPTVLELGGSDPFIVLADCDLEKTLDGAIAGRTQNNGQSCIAAKRFILERGVLDEFTERFAQRMGGLVVGDPMLSTTDIGPLARRDLVDTLHEQVERTLTAGARLLTGGQRPDGPGYYYPPTVVSEVVPGMALFDEETFGPVAAVVAADDLEHAVELANMSDFGLGASVWTTRSEGLEAIAARLHVGHVAFNGIVKSDPRLPFGGVKDSGYGRELSRHGLLEFVNRKSVWIG